MKDEGKTNGGRRDLPAPSTRRDTLTPAQRSLHNNFLVSVRTLKTGLVRSVYYLDQVRSHRIHRLLGHRTIAEYALAYAGFTANQTREFLYIARRLKEFPLVAAALQDGSLSWGKAREICRKVDPGQQRVWIDLARSLPRNRLREIIESEPVGRISNPVTPGTPLDPETAERRPGESTLSGDRSQAIAHHEPRQRGKPVVLQETCHADAAGGGDHHYVTLRFSAEQMARWDSLIQHAMRHGSEGKEEAVLVGLAGAMTPDDGAEGGPRARPPYLVVILRCPDCGKGAIVHDRGESEAGAALLGAVGCDSVIEKEDGRRRRTIPASKRRAALRRARYRCQAEGCGRTRFLEVHHRRPVAGGGGVDSDNLVVLCRRCHRALHEQEERAREAVAGAPV